MTSNYAFQPTASLRSAAAERGRYASGKTMTRTLVAVALLSFFSAGAMAQPDEIEDGRLDPNCATALMPDDVEPKPKLIETHGFAFYQTPDQIPEGFTGCQVIWLENGHRLLTRHYKAGELTWVRGQEVKEVRPSFCVYKDGKLNKKASFNLRRCKALASEMD